MLAFGRTHRLKILAERDGFTAAEVAIAIFPDAGTRWWERLACVSMAGPRYKNLVNGCARAEPRLHGGPSSLKINVGRGTICGFSDDAWVMERCENLYFEP